MKPTAAENRLTFRERVASIRRNVNLPSMFDGMRRITDDKWSGCCPLHGGDNVNNFVVSRRNDREWHYRCFRCDAFGDAIDLVMSRERCSMRDAVNILDGGQAMPGPRPEIASASRPDPSSFLVCDPCRNEVIEIRSREYGGGSRPRWTSSIELEAATAPGWELSADLEYAVGPKCLTPVVPFAYGTLAEETIRHARHMEWVAV